MIAYGLVNLAALLRVFGPALGATAYGLSIAAAGACWVVAFVLFCAVYAPILCTVRRDGRPG